MKRTSSLLVFVVLFSLASFGSQSPSQARRALQSTQSKMSRTSAKWTLKNQISNPAPTSVGWLAAPTFPGAGVTNALFPSAIGDFNGDGNKDVAMVVNNPGNNSYLVSTSLGNGDGTFKIPTTLGTTAAVGIWSGKLHQQSNNDDLVVAHTGSPSATYEILSSQGDGTFISSGLVSLGSGSVITWGALYDVNGDGKLDLVFADATNSLIWTAIGNGDGTFKSATSVPFLTPQGGQGIAAGTSVVFADFDGDGILDFAAHDAKTNQINVYYGTGTGYTPPAPLSDSTGFDSCYDAAGDLNADGHPEIVSTNGGCLHNGLQNSITVYVNGGTNRTFQSGVRYSVGISPVADTLADVNGDGKLDVVVSDCNSSDIRVFLGNGDGTFQAASPGYATGGEPHAPPMVADFNNDGKADVVVPDQRLAFVYLQGYGDGSFRSAINYYANPIGNGLNPTAVSIASGDFNGDGITDFVIGNINTSSNTPNTGVTIFLSNPDGSMQEGVPLSSFASTQELEYVAVADFDGDGKLDIAAADAFNGIVQIFYGKGDGTFQIGAAYSTGTSGSTALGLVAGDFNRDGHPDIAVVNNQGTTSANVGILLNDGKGNFNAAVNYPLSTIATEITAADINGDDKLDLVVPLNGTSTTPGTAVALLLGNGDGTFKAESDVSVGGQSPYYATVGDLNGDGKADMAVTVNDPNNPGIAILAGNGDGTFQAPSLIPIAPQGSPISTFLPYIKMADMNRDGHLDLIYTNAWLNSVNLLYNKGDGTFPYDPLSHPASRFVWDFVLADANGDGVLDVVATGNGPMNGYAFSGVTVLLNTSGAGLSLQSSVATTGNGMPITFTATVTPSKVRGVTAVPSGTVTFMDGSTPVSSPLSLAQSNVVTFTTSALSLGSHNIVAQYSGDHNYVVENSSAVKQVVLQPDYTLQASPSSQNVNPGSSGNFTITLNTATGYDGTVTFSCPSNLPAGVSCVLPNMAPPYPPATLTIKTTGPSAALVAPQIAPHHDSNLWASLSGLGVFGLVLAGGKKRNRKHAAVALTIIALVLILALVGCGSGSSANSGGGGGGGNGGTPAGTYQIQVTATGTAGSHSGNTSPHVVTVKLVVQ